jgi:hypothetical protein
MTKFEAAAQRIKNLGDNLGTVINGTNEIIDELVSEECRSREIPFELPAMTLLRIIKQRILNRGFKIFLTPEDLEEIVILFTRELDLLVKDYSQETVSRAFTNESFKNSGVTIQEALFGEMELLRKICDSVET